MKRLRMPANLRDVDNRTWRILGLVAGGALIAALLLYWLVVRNSEAAGSDQACSGSEVLYWYDPMVPDQQFDAPGQSPFMDMALVAKCADEAAEGVQVSPSMMQNLGIRVVEAEMRDIAPTVPAVGRVEIDERLIAEVQTLTPGFVEHLAVRAEGEPINRGSLVARVYSPELLTAQNEYKSVLGMAESVAPASLRSASRQRLSLLGMPDGQIRRLERGGAPQRTFPVYAPTSGVVTDIGTRPGAQVSLGQSIVTIAGLSRVWVVAEVPEAALGDIRAGLPAEIRFPAYPDDVREGVIDYVYPSLDPEARTARVRFTLANPGGRLLEGMFANITIQGTGGMALVVPSEAVIDTGRRTVVIVRRTGGFVPVEVRLGRETGEWTQILEGIEVGDPVVASGQFLIDSEASLSGIIERLEAAPPQPSTDDELAAASGRIRAINTESRTLTIEHGPVPEMNWPPMTMDFAVQRPGQLRGLRSGNRVEFRFQRRQQGNRYMIDRIRKVSDE
ncbi:MAG: efflux RND transporter periplasmic adaptor subunit [Parasphingopyxis sp.]|uniref:efflux RND transporter periplasmic adaptor subunit n=1 Tax=Parasphingopyxis sp. TaxID=1920299 RepID=UPI0032EC5BC7